VNGAHAGDGGPKGRFAFGDGPLGMVEVPECREQAVKFLTNNGRDKFIAEVAGPKGQFHFQPGQKKDLYIFVYDEKGSGWIEYKELNPAAGNKVMNKASFVELKDKMIIGCGIYK
jgi:hypothetical protein